MARMTVIPLFKFFTCKFAVIHSVLIIKEDFMSKLSDFLVYMA